MLKRRYAFLVWLIGSLVAIALIGDAPYIGLGVALASGVLFGILNALGSRPDRH
jgi:hypothetical protein